MKTPQELRARFEHRFGRPARLFRAPGRVNLIGEHTDYNEGFVLPAAIDFSTTVAAATRDDCKFVIYSENFDEQVEFDLDCLPSRRAGKWFDYIVSVAWVLRQRTALRGANLLIRGDVPIGAGLSSSAAVEVSTALALIALSADEQAQKIPRPEIAKLCRRAENEFVGAQVGIMDQFVSCTAERDHALLLDCRSLGYKLVPIPPSLRLVICNTMVKHDLASGSYNQRRAECEEGVRIFAAHDPKIRALRDVTEEAFHRYSGELTENVRKRCEHVIRENARVLAAVKCLREADFARLGKLMSESHASLRDLYEVSCDELDAMVESACDLPGCIGARMTGGGFGGCTINLVEADHAQNFVGSVAERYDRATGIKPQIYLCTAEDGAKELA